MEVKNEKYSPNWFYAYVGLFIFILIILLGYLASLYSIYVGIEQIYLTFFLILVTAFYGFLSINEFLARYDFISLTPEGVKYQNSPKFIVTGWLTKSGLIPYSDISNLRVVHIKTGLEILDEKLSKQESQTPDLLTKPLLVEIVLKNSKVIRIGDRLPPAKVIQIAVLLEGRAQLGNMYANFQEKFPNLVSMAKETITKISEVFKKEKPETD